MKKLKKNSHFKNQNTAWELEMKAHVKDFESTKKRLDSLFLFKVMLEKSDTYYIQYYFNM